MQPGAGILLEKLENKGIMVSVMDKTTLPLMGSLDAKGKSC